MVPKIVVDVHERRSGVPDALRELGLAVEMRVLGVGDYLIRDTVLVERKTVYGLHDGVIGGRCWSQIGRLRASRWRPVLLVEGCDLDAGPLPAAGVRGVCVAVIGLGVTLAAVGRCPGLRSVVGSTRHTGVTRLPAGSPRV